MPSNKLIRFNILSQRVPLSRSTIWRLEKEGKFPSRRKLGKNTVAWLEAEIDKWIADRRGSAQQKGRTGAGGCR